MKLLLESWREFLEEAAKTPAWLRNADPRVINDVLRAAADENADEFAKQLLLGFLKIETAGSSKYTFYDPEVAQYKDNIFKKPRSNRYAGPFQIIHGRGKKDKEGYTGIERAYKKYGYDTTKFGDPHHQATVVLRYIESRRRKFGDNPTRIYLSWNQGPGGSAAIYRALQNNPNMPVGSEQFDHKLAGRMKNNFSHLSLKRHGISNKSQMTPKMFVSNYERLLGFVGSAGAKTAGGTAVGVPKGGKRYVIIAGNSHAGATFSRIKNEYKRLEKETGIDYVIKRIDAAQGHGGEIPAQLAKIKRLGNELRGKGAFVAAIIHTGTDRYGSQAKAFDELAKEYISLTDNVTFIGSPTSRSDFKGSGDRVQWNNWLRGNLSKYGIKYVETAGVTGDKDLVDNVHLSRKGYNKMMSAAIPQINFDSGTNATKAAGPAAVGLPQTSAITRGKFVHGISPIEKFKFDVFYDELARYFGADAIDKMLPTHGKDYKFGREHQKAYDDLQEAKKTSAPAGARVAGPAAAAANIPVAQPEEEELGECPEGQFAANDGYCYEYYQSAEDIEKMALPPERYDVNDPDPLKRGQPKQLKDYTRRLTESKNKNKQKIKIKVLTKCRTI
jgi:hypothetical protein